MLDVKVQDGATSIYTSKISCPNSTDIGLGVNIFRAKAGQIMVYWSNNREFKSDDSLGRYYPEGYVQAEFAFSSGDSNYVRVDINADKSSYEIDNLKLYCLY